MDLNIAGKLKQSLLEGNRKPDGLLHCSGLAHCEYSQIQQAMGEVNETEPDLIDLTVMYTGTMWHKVIQDNYGDTWVWKEQDVSDYMPEGWSGTIDGLILPDQTVRVLVDVKTMNGEGMRYIKGVKPEHRWQVSAYYWAVNRYIKMTWPDSNIKLHPQAVIFYMPVSRAKDYVAEPIEIWFDPLPEDVVIAEMEKRATALQWYKDTGENIGELMPMEITEKRSTGGWKTIHMANNWWVNYCPAKDCPCAKRSAKLLGKRDPGGMVQTNANADPGPVQILQLIQEQNERRSD